MAQILDGRKIAAEVEAEVAARVGRLRERGIEPCLRVILVGEHPASLSYVRGKARAAARVGIDGQVIRLPADAGQQALLAEVARLNADPAVHGILVQLPLPDGVDEASVTLAIDPAKDVDGFHPVNVGRLHIGLESLLPCTPHGIIQMLERSAIPIAGRHAVVVGRSNLVGKPAAMLLLGRHATVTVAHSRTPDLAKVTAQADILVVAVGRPNLVTGAMIKPGAAVIDVGVNRVGDRLVGDVDFASADGVAGWLTPVPGGVGPMTIAMLLHNTVTAAERIGRPGA